MIAGNGGEHVRTREEIVGVPPPGIFPEVEMLKNQIIVASAYERSAEINLRMIF